MIIIIIIIIDNATSSAEGIKQLRQLNDRYSLICPVPSSTL